MQQGKLLAQQGNYKAALDVYTGMLQSNPDNAELLTTVGLLYLRLGETYRAFDFLGNSLTHDPRNVKTILAAASVIQVSCTCL